MKTQRMLLIALALTCSAAPAAAQDPCAKPGVCDGVRMRADFGQELSAAGVNALLGGLTAAVSQGLQGEPVLPAFVRGAVGGGVVYAGKRVAVEGFDGAGFLGRELGSVGGSIVRNASSGRGMLEELVLPVGPLRLYVSRERGVIPRVDLATVVAAGAFLARDGRFDAGASLSAGALVFRGDGLTPGLSSAGAMMVWDDMPAHEGPRLLAHERVHILQYDQAYLSWGERPERWLGERSPFSDLLDHVDAGGLMLGVQASLRYAIDYRARPWEREAYLLSQLAHPVAVEGLPHVH